MQISISARHGDLSASTCERIEEKVRKLPRFFDRLTAIEVMADLERQDDPKVEIKVSAEQTEGFVSSDTGANVISALDSALHKMEQQLRKHKERLTGHRGPGHRHLNEHES